MTLDQILAELESLKDFVNDTKKPSLEALKAVVKALAEETAEKPKEPVVIEPEPVVAPEFHPVNVVKKKRKSKGTK